MTTPTWIVYERTTRWAAALRMALSSGQPALSPTLLEVRSLPELTGRLKIRPDCFVLVEVTPANFEATLTWLAATTSREKHVAAIALLDFRRTDNPVRPLFKDGRDCPSYDRDIVATALREAGALDVIDSPRQIRSVLGLGEHHAGKCNVAMSRHAEANETFESWAWGLLPWQDAGRPVG